MASITATIDHQTVSKELDLQYNKKINFEETIAIGKSQFSDPYWLRNKATLGMYNVDKQLLIGKPETPRPAKIDFNLRIDNVPITITKNIVRRYSERDKGEIYEPFEVLPEFYHRCYLFLWLL